MRFYFPCHSPSLRFALFFFLPFRIVISGKPFEIAYDYPAFFPGNQPFRFYFFQQSVEILRSDGKQLGDFPLLQWQLQSSDFFRLKGYHCRTDLSKQFLKALSGRKASYICKPIYVLAHSSTEMSLYIPGKIGIGFYQTQKDGSRKAAHSALSQR